MKNKQHIIVKVLLAIFMIVFRKNAYSHGMSHSRITSQTISTVGTVSTGLSGSQSKPLHLGVTTSPLSSSPKSGPALGSGGLGGHHMVSAGLPTTSPSTGSSVLTVSTTTVPTILPTTPTTIVPTILPTTPTTTLPTIFPTTPTTTLPTILPSTPTTTGGLVLSPSITTLGSVKHTSPYPTQTIAHNNLGQFSNTPTNSNNHKNFVLSKPNKLNQPEIINEQPLTSSLFTDDSKIPTIPVQKPVAYTFNNTLTNLIWNNILQNDSHDFYNLSTEKEDFCILCFHSEVNYINSKKIGKLVYLNSHMGMKYNIYDDDYLSLFISVPTINLLKQNSDLDQSNIISGVMYKHEIPPYSLSLNVGYAYQKFTENTLTNHRKAEENGLLLSTKLNRKFSSHDHSTRMANLGLILSNHIFYGQVNTNDSYYLYKEKIFNDISELTGYLGLKESYKIYHVILTPNIILSANILYNYTKNSYNYITPNANPNATDIQKNYALRNHSFDMQGEITTSLHMQIHDKYNINLGLSAGHSKYTKNLRIYIGLSI